MVERPHERAHRKVEAYNLVRSTLLGQLAAVADGDEQHVVENIEGVIAEIEDDLQRGTGHSGAKTGYLLTDYGRVVQILCGRIAGPDALAQIDVLVEALDVLGRQINDER